MQRIKGTVHAVSYLFRMTSSLETTLGGNLLWKTSNHLPSKHVSTTKTGGSISESNRQNALQNTQRIQHVEYTTRKGISSRKGLLVRSPTDLQPSGMSSHILEATRTSRYHGMGLDILNINQYIINTTC